MPYKTIMEMHIGVKDQRSENVVQLLKELQEEGRLKRVPLPGESGWKGRSNSHGFVVSAAVESRIVDIERGSINVYKT